MLKYSQTLIWVLETGTEPEFGEKPRSVMDPRWLGRPSWKIVSYLGVGGRTRVPVVRVTWDGQLQVP